MPEVLPALRGNLDVMPSPVPERPGLLLRDPFRYAEATLIIPPPLVPLLALFNGTLADTDAKAALVRSTGDLRASELVERMRDTLSTEGFLEDDVFARRRDERHRDFAAAARRKPGHAGAAYPAEPDALRALLDGLLGASDPIAPAPGRLVGIAAPHVSLEGGGRCYAAAYRALPREADGRTFVILGTSHYGEPGTFGITRKPFVTPYGPVSSDEALVAELAAAGGPGVRLEDYCHAVEHSIEFQVLFLHHLYGAGLRILPILCGPLPCDPDRQPDAIPGVHAFLEALASLASREERRVVFVLGVDMAHVGRRYGDDAQARVGSGALLEVEQRDRQRCARLAAGDAEGFWRLLADASRGGDDLRWCGAAPFYAFLRVAGAVRGELIRYDQWNIDEGSVVSFAGLRFFRA